MKCWREWHAFDCSSFRDLARCARLQGPGASDASRIPLDQIVCHCACVHWCAGICLDSNPLFATDEFYSGILHNETQGPLPLAADAPPSPHPPKPCCLPSGGPAPRCRCPRGPPLPLPPVTIIIGTQKLSLAASPRLTFSVAVISDGRLPLPSHHHQCPTNSFASRLAAQDLTSLKQ